MTGSERVPQSTSEDEKHYRSDLVFLRGFYREELRLATNLEKSQISVRDFSTSLQIGVGSRFAEAAGAGLAPQVRHMVRIAHEGP
jgi:hypothetical protein